jgi:D-alanyl-D-alanine dipeptidase
VNAGSIVLALILAVAVPCVSANDIEQKFIAAGLVDVHRIDRSIQVDLVNSDPDKNIFRENFYHGLTRAYLRRAVANKLSKAQAILKSKDPGMSLLILDAARPRSVSQRMYDKLKGTKFERFVANPAQGSMHNYGIAVDITIVGRSGKELDMGFSPFRKGRLALYWALAKRKLGVKPDRVQMNNRRLLADTMQCAGFLPLRHEWWHFNGMAKSDARRRYAIIE